MNLNDPEMQKQLERWDTRWDTKMTPEEQTARAWAAIRALEDRQRERRLQREAERIDALFMRELQPARGWADYDTAFLKDLGISPLDPQ